MQQTNRQDTISFTLPANTETNVLHTVQDLAGTGMALNGGLHVHADVQCKNVAGVTAQIYIQATIDSLFSKAPLAVFALPGSSTTSVDFDVCGYAWQLTLDPGVNNNVEISVSACVYA